MCKIFRFFHKYAFRIFQASAVHSCITRRSLKNFPNAARPSLPFTRRSFLTNIQCRKLHQKFLFDDCLPPMHRFCLFGRCVCSIQGQYRMALTILRERRALQFDDETITDEPFLQCTVAAMTPRDEALKSRGLPGLSFPPLMLCSSIVHG